MEFEREKIIIVCMNRLMLISYRLFSSILYSGTIAIQEIRNVKPKHKVPLFDRSKKRGFHFRNKLATPINTHNNLIFATFQFISGDAYK
jgi:hypothetical protein